MKVLDLDMDYFLECDPTSIGESQTCRLPEQDYGHKVWDSTRVRLFFEKNLGLSKSNKIKGLIIVGHNESIPFWEELIKKGNLIAPFEVIHVDSHADLGLGYSSWEYILNTLLQYPVKSRPKYNKYIDCFGKMNQEGIGDYLLFAIAYRWISKLTYCANPNGDKNDYLWCILKDFHENEIWDDPVENPIQLIHNPNMAFLGRNASDDDKKKYLDAGIKEPEVPMTIIPTVKDVQFSGDFDFALLAQSPNYTPASADFIMDIFREYIEEI